LERFEAILERFRAILKRFVAKNKSLERFEIIQ